MPSLIDTIRLNETPEGVDLELRVAGPVVRALALSLDVLIRFGIMLLMLPLAGFAGVGQGLILIGVFALEWGYPVAFEVYRGATPGKRAMGLMVVQDDGAPIGLAASMVRNLLRVIDFLPFGYGVGLVAALADPDFRRLGDLAAGTLVVHTPRQIRPKDVATSPARPVPAGLRLETQQAILSFDERARRLSSARRVELAEILTVGSGIQGEAAVAQVAGWATWLRRGRGQGLS